MGEVRDGDEIGTNLASDVGIRDFESGPFL
jgi:hypothetical protein